MKTYKPEFKAKLVQALLAGSSVADLAKQHKVPVQTLHLWRRLAQNKANVKSARPVKSAAYNNPPPRDIRQLIQQTEAKLALLKSIEAELQSG